MQIKLLSDIHLEFYKEDEIPSASSFLNSDRSDFLCLCGDLGDPFSERYRAFLTQCAKMQSYKHIFVIAGNHEFYGHTEMENVVKHMHELCNELGPTKVTFLEKEGFDIPETDIRVVGSTLWSEIESEQASDIRCFIADYRRIPAWTMHSNDTVHKESLAFIHNELKSAKLSGKRLIVMSHHAPLLVCGKPEHQGSQLSSAFKNDLYELINQNTEQIAAWFYGHDHHSACLRVGNTTVASFQKGYPGENVHKCSFDGVVKI